MKLLIKVFCLLVGHRDEPAGCRINNGPFILSALVCRRCRRVEVVP